LKTADASDPRTLYDAGPDRRGYFDRDEAVGREQIILATLVDDAQVAVPLGVLVGKDGVDLVALKRAFVACVLNADRKPATD